MLTFFYFRGFGEKETPWIMIAECYLLWVGISICSLNDGLRVRSCSLSTIVWLNPALRLRISFDSLERGSSIEPDNSPAVALRPRFPTLVPVVELGASLWRVPAFVDCPASFRLFPPTAVPAFLLIIVDDGQYVWLIYPALPGDIVLSKKLFKFS